MTDKQWADLVGTAVITIVMAILSTDISASSLIYKCYIVICVIGILRLGYRAQFGWPKAKVTPSNKRRVTS